MQLSCSDRAPGWHLRSRHSLSLNPPAPPYPLRKHFTKTVAAQELLKFMQKNQAQFWAAKHVSPPSEYLEWWDALEAEDAGAKPGAASEKPASKAPIEREARPSRR
jgi:hypothetical protein